MSRRIAIGGATHRRRFGALVAASLLAGSASLSLALPAVALDFCQQIGQGTATNDFATTLEDHAVSINLVANDSCYGSSWGFTVMGPPAHGTIAGGGSLDVTYTPDADWNGTETFAYAWHSNTYGWNAAANVTITVTPVNDQPTFEYFYQTCSGDTPTSGRITVAEDSGTTSKAYCFRVDTDKDWTEASQTATAILSVDKPGLFSDGPTASFYGKPSPAEWDYGLQFTPAPNANGTATVTLTPKDDGGTANGGVDTGSPVTLTIVITPVNDAPVAKPDSYSTAFGSQLVVPANKGVLHNDTDVDGPSLSASVKTSPAHGVLALSPDGSFTYTPTAGFSGSDSFVYTVSDGSLKDTATVNLTVQAADASPASSAPVAGETDAVPTGSPAVSAGPVAAAGGETAGATAGPAAPGSSEQGSDIPWLPIIVIVVLVVVGSNVAIFQVMRRRPRGGGGEPGP